MQGLMIEVAIEVSPSAARLAMDPATIVPTIMALQVVGTYDTSEPSPSRDQKRMERPKKRCVP